jgi:hypothetical protein
MENELRDALYRMSQKRTPTLVVKSNPDLREALEQELAAFDQVIGLQQIADAAAFDPEKFLDELHKMDNEEKD